MDYEAHYNNCYNLLVQLIEKYTSEYKQTVNPEKIFVHNENIGYEKYKDGFDPDEYRENLIKQISSSNDFIQLFSQITSRSYKQNFSLFGNEFSIDIKEKLIGILNLSLMMYGAINKFHLIEEKFKDLYYSLYADKFIIEIVTILDNFESVEIELLNRHNLNVGIKKMSEYTSIIYKITGMKNDKKNSLEYPETIINIVMGILRVYKSPRIDYFINNVKYSPGCPEFMKTESSPFLYRRFTKEYYLTADEVQTFKNFFQRAYLSEEKVAMALQRFSLACGRESDYDRLLDLVFTLELLFGSGGPESIKHKILIRLINLLSDSKEVRQVLYTKMNDLYLARNTIVHGLEKQSKVEIVIRNLHYYEEIIRKAILIFIDTMTTHKLRYNLMMNKLDFDKSTIYEMDITSMNWKE